MGKKSKEHRKKVASRNLNISNAKKSTQKLQEEYLKQLIERERQNGSFDQPSELLNDSSFTVVDLDGPTL